MAQTKATKKFEKNHLKDTLKRRKDFAKIKQRHQLNAKKKAKRASEAQDDRADSNGDSVKAQRLAKGASHDAFEDMTVDEFFAGGFGALKGPKSRKKRPGKRKRPSDSDENDTESSVASIEEHAAAASDISSKRDEQERVGEVGMHKQDLRALKEKDPEFHKFLQEEDPELLGFGEDSNLAEVDQLSDAEEHTHEQERKAQRNLDDKDLDSNEVSSSMVKTWSTAMREKSSLTAMKEVVLAFRAAAHLNDEDGANFKYSISNADVYHDLLMCALKQVPEVLNHNVPVKELANRKTQVSMDSKKFKALTSLLKSHTLSIQHLLANLSDAATIKAAMSSILSLLPYLLSFKKLIRNLCRSISDIWSDSTQAEATQVSAFLILRRLAVIGDPGIQENVLRTAYSGLLRGARSTTVHTLLGINLMKNSAVDLWGLVTEGPPKSNQTLVAYTSSFQFIRSLAIHLRNCIKHNANEAYKNVYNWQYVHALDFWSRVLSSSCDCFREATRGRESPLRPLIYPLTQVTLGAMRLIPAAAYFPLRFHLIRALLRLSSTTNTFIPLATPLYEVLSSAEMRKPPRPSTLKPLDFETSIRAQKSYLRTRIYQDGAGEQATELLAEFFVVWAKHIAFPELALPVLVMLKRWLKEASPYNPRGQPAADRSAKSQAAGNKNMKLNGSVSLLIQKLEANSRFVEECRVKVEYAPSNRAGVEGFLKELEWSKTPLGAFVSSQRKIREEKRRIVEEARRDEEEKRKAERDGGGENALRSASEEEEDLEVADLAEDDNDEDMQVE